MPSGPMPVGSICRNSRRAAAHVVDADHVRALGADEQQRAAAERGDLEALGLVALVLRARLRVVTGAHDLVLEARARLVLDAAVGVEQREAARAALLAVLVLVVALVGGGERVVVDPRDRVGLAPARDRVGRARSGRCSCGPSSSSVASMSRTRRRCRPRSAASRSRAARSTIARWLFSCRVTTAWLRRLMSTYSGSGSSGAIVGEAGQRDRAAQSAQSGARSSTCSDAGGQLRDQRRR